MRIPAGPLDAWGAPLDRLRMDGSATALTGRAESVDAPCEAGCVEAMIGWGDRWVVAALQHGGRLDLDLQTLMPPLTSCDALERVQRADARRAGDRAAVRRSGRQAGAMRFRYLPVDRQCRPAGGRRSRLSPHPGRRKIQEDSDPPGSDRRGGGQRGIRTLGTLSRTHAFQACAIDHSATCPFHAWARPPGVVPAEARLIDHHVPLGKPVCRPYMTTSP